MTTEGHGVSTGDTQSDTRKGGSMIQVESNVTLTAITKHASCNATTGYVYNDNGGSPTLMASAAFSGDVCTFGTSQSLTTGNTYHVVADSDGASYTFYFWSAPTYPIDSGYINWTDGSLSLSGASANAPYDIATVTFTVPTNVTITPSALALTGTLSSEVGEVDKLPSALASTMAQPAETHEITRFPSVLTLTTGDPEDIFIVEAPVSAVTSSLATLAPVPQVHMLPSSVALVLRKADGNAHTVNPTGTVEVGSGTAGARYVRKTWPFTVGLTAGTTKSQTNPSL